MRCTAIAAELWPKQHLGYNFVRVEIVEFEIGCVLDPVLDSNCGRLKFVGVLACTPIVHCKQNALAQSTALVLRQNVAHIRKRKAVHRGGCYTGRAFGWPQAAGL